MPLLCQAHALRALIPTDSLRSNLQAGGCSWVGSQTPSQAGHLLATERTGGESGPRLPLGAAERVQGPGVQALADLTVSLQ